MGGPHALLTELISARTSPAAQPRPDPVRQAKQRLLGSLPLREDSQVLCDFVEDDLREGLQAIGEIEAHFTDVLDLLRSGPLTPAALLEVGEDLLVLQRLEQLHTTVAQLRKRLSKAAGSLRRR